MATKKKTRLPLRALPNGCTMRGNRIVAIRRGSPFDLAAGRLPALDELVHPGPELVRDVMGILSDHHQGAATEAAKHGL